MMKPFALSRELVERSKGRSWFDKALLSEVEGLTTNGFRFTKSIHA